MFLFQIALVTKYFRSEAAELKLVDLAKSSVVKVGDVLAYKRNFSQLDMTVEKDVVVRFHIPMPFLSCLKIKNRSNLSIVAPLQ